MKGLEFNKQQLEAINHFKGACAVIAGAGSGKSTVLLNRIKNLVEQHKILENKILTISFTRNTADELKEKLNKMGIMNTNVGTFHSVCAKILSNEGINITKNNIIKEWEIENLFKKIDKKADIKEIMSFISYQKNYLRSYKDEFILKNSDYTEYELREFYKAYENFKDNNDLYDLDDYLIKCYEILKRKQGKYTYDFVLVDEHQDSNLVQNLLLKEWCKSGNIFAVFDYRQAIYTFRGGNPEYCMNFSGEWNNAKIINLDENYRSKSNIVNRANGFIKRYYGDYEYYSDSIPNCKDKGNVETLTFNNKEDEGEKIANQIEVLLSKGVSPSEIAVLYRLNSHSSHVENELKKREIEYDITNNSSFFKRKEIDGIMSYLRLIRNPHDDNAFKNIFNFRNYPIQFFSGKILDEVTRFSGLNNLSLYESFITMKYKLSWQNNYVDIFKNNITRLKMQLDKGVDVCTLIDNVVKVFKINGFIEEKYSNDEDINDRKNSIQILKSFVKSDNLDKFISYVYNNINNKSKSKKEKVQLMTIHASKGLEFEYVFLIGVEDGKFPHDKSDIMDEARLFYVGVTRAKDNLYISQIYDGNRFVDEYAS